VTEQTYRVFRFGDIEVREREFLLVKAGETLPVEPKAFRVLLFLLSNPGRLVTKDELLNGVWNDCSVSDNSLTRSIATLRRLLRDDTHEPRYIATVPTVGYRFLCPVHVSEQTLSKHTTPDLLRTAAGIADEMSGRDESYGSEFLDSIAVLPFENAGGEPDMEYLSDGITASIINNLSQLNRLRVVPRTTAFRYKGKVRDAAKAGRELRVRVVLTGQVSQRGDVLMMNVELIDAAHESQLWGANYNGGSEDIFSMQAEIAEQITIKLKLRLDEEEIKRLGKRPTQSREAYYLYFKAMHWANKWTAEGIRKGIDYTRQAIDADPAYAQAWTALAYLYVLIGFFGGAPSNETLPKAKAAALKAVGIDDNEANAHATLAYVRLVYDWDWQGAHKELLRAIELGPNLGPPHYVYSHWYLTQGLYAEAFREGKLASTIDPLSVQFHYHVGVVHYFGRQYDRAIEQLQKTTDLDPNFGPAHQSLAVAYARKGVSADTAELRKSLEPAKNNLHGALLGMLCALTGKPEEARAILIKLKQDVEPPNFPSAYYCAALHALLGDRDEAFAYLDQARRGRSVQLAYVAVAPELDSLHDDPRFPGFLRSIGIPASIP
jgi:TolB-like protein/DNA-binding winged helix-turn-helix (wHTH) protein/Tfp pilus assembly protein PilF